MFQTGDVVICVDNSINSLIDGESTYDVSNLKLYGKYIIRQELSYNSEIYNKGKDYIVTIDDIRYTIFNSNRFVKLSKYRISKINKILNNDR